MNSADAAELFIERRHQIPLVNVFADRTLKLVGHVGLYGYRADVLAGWMALPVSPLEDLEKLEQLRLIDAGIPLLTFVVDQDCLSVDTPEQLEQARALA